MHCSICGKKNPKMKRCSKCKTKIYCSRECQVSDWPTHRSSCPPPPPAPLPAAAAAAAAVTSSSTSSKTIAINHNKIGYDVTLNDGMTGEEIMAEIALQLRIPERKLKLISRGKMLTQQNSRERIFGEPTRKFMAFGEQQEAEEDLHTGDVDTIVQQTNVDRNVAIRALRKCQGNLIDALLLVG